MPSGFVDDPESDVADEEVNDGGFGDDILAADADGVDVLLLNVGQHHASAVTDDLCRGIDDKGVGCVPEPLLHVRSERLLAFIRKGDIALSDGFSNTSRFRGLALKIPTGISSRLAFLCFCR